MLSCGFGKLITLVVIATGLAYQFSGFLLQPYSSKPNLPIQVRAAAKISAGGGGAPREF